MTGETGLRHVQREADEKTASERLEHLPARGVPTAPRSRRGAGAGSPHGPLAPERRPLASVQSWEATRSCRCAARGGALLALSQDSKARGRAGHADMVP